MLDLPELALGLTAIAMFLRALDSRSTIWAIAAGLVAGLACQTKYTGLLLPPVLFGFACMHRQPLKGVIAGAATAALFVAWETLIARRYGESHFLVSLSQASDGWWLKAYFILPSVALLGGVGIAIAFVGLAALGFRTRWIALAGIALALGYAALAFLSDAAASLWLPDVPPRIGVATIVFFTAGWCVVGILSLTAFRQLVRLRRRSNWLRWDVVLRRCQPVWLLLFWLAVELAGYYLLTPFPATRRVLGITIVGMLIVARLASRSQRWRPRPGVLRLAAMISAIVGICYAALDIADSHREPAAIHQAEQFIREHDAEPRIWFVGHWGLQYEAERRGFHPVVPWNSVLRAGDWLLLPPRTFPQQSMLADQRMGNPVHVVQIDRKLRLRTLPAYYGGYYPMEWWPSPHFELRIYRIEADWMPVFDRASG